METLLDEKRSQCSRHCSEIRRGVSSVEEELLRQRRQVPAAGLRHDDEILDADTAQTRVVQARLHGDDVADFKDHVGLVDARVLVDLEPEPVSRPVDESGVALDVPVRLRERAIAVLLEDLAAREVHVAAVRARP